MAWIFERKTYLIGILRPIHHEKTILLLGALAVSAVSQARTWTSANGENTFEADYLSSDANVKQLIMPYFPGGRMGVPSYVLVDQTGKEVARGKTAAFAKIKEME